MAPLAPTTPPLSDDIVLEFLRRLPCRAGVLCAALACKPWFSAVRSPAGQVFLSEFFAAHPPPLLGMYVFVEREDFSGQTFIPVRQSDRPLAAALGGGDFFLERLPRYGGAGWEIRDCRDGYLLLANSKTGKLAVYHPLTCYIRFYGWPPQSKVLKSE